MKRSSGLALVRAYEALAALVLWEFRCRWCESLACGDDCPAVMDERDLMRAGSR